MTQINQKHGPQELLKRMGPEVYRAAYDKGMSLSAYLEIYEDPSEQYKDGSDAFGRLLAVADIRTRSIPELGVYASEYEAFSESENTRALVPEFIARTWRRVQTGKSPNTRSLYTSGDAVAGSWERPYAEAQTAKWDIELQPAIPLQSLIAMTTPIDGDTYRSYYLTNTTANNRMVRVGEAAEIPRVKLTASQHTIDLHKYGRSMEASYEQLRRQRIDKIAFHIARMAVQAEVDKVATAIDVAVNGDGNSNAATTYDLTTLDTGTTANNLTLKAWLAFKMKFVNPYMITVALTREANALSLLMLDVGSINVPLVTVAAAAGYGGFTQINPGLRDNVALGWTDDAPANNIVGIDARMALERVVETGSTINEIERFTTRQTQTLTMTEVEGYAVLDENATKILVTNA